MSVAVKQNTGSVYDRWVVCAAGYGLPEAVGDTRENAVIKALTLFPHRF